MPKPTCPKCDSTRFEMDEIKVEKANYKHNAIFCKNCGCVIAVMEFYNITARLEVLAKKLGIKIDG